MISNRQRLMKEKRFGVFCEWRLDEFRLQFGDFTVVGAFDVCFWRLDG
jgi:hypothetical protein